ncbi:hypothetical protein BGW80DRAFT_1254536 [Lactifluus volemus]|nr:hypothetical protein BGW80DRAFT_1254536 [Lactifluus volemus]
MRAIIDHGIPISKADAFSNWKPHSLQICNQGRVGAVVNRGTVGDPTRCMGCRSLLSQPHRNMMWTFHIIWVVLIGASQHIISTTHCRRRGFEFSVQTFTLPLDHFYDTTDATFQQRFWVNTRHYKPRPGSPVIVIDGGETNGEDHLPFLDTGIADILDRYYGKSVGVQNVSTDSLRWLNNEQALEDSVNLMRNVKIENINEDLTARKTSWIYYGVTHAVLTNWEYTNIIRLAAEPICSSNLVNSISMIDSLLKLGPLRGRLKPLFGLGELESDKDFASALEDQNWDPAVSSTTFDQFCATPNGDTPTLRDTDRTMLLPGGLKANIALLNYAKWIRETAPPVGTPTIISCLLDIEYEHKICIQAFPAGEYYKVPPLPNVTSVNVLGDYHLAADSPSTPFLNGSGEADQGWVVSTTGTRTRFERAKRNPRNFGKFINEMVEFVKAWLEDWVDPFDEAIV